MMKVLVSLFLILNLSYADHYEPEYALFKEHIPGDLNFLGLSDTQKIAIREILSNNMKRVEKLHEKEERVEKRLKGLFLKKRFDEKRYVEELIKIKSMAAKVEASMLKELHSVLTPKQRERFIEYFEEWEVE